MRTLTYTEVRNADHYADMAELSAIFNHDIVEDDEGVWRWKANGLTCHFSDGSGPFYTGVWPSHACQHYRGSVDFNALAVDFAHGKFSAEEYAKFYMQTGYSLCGWAEVFGQRDAKDYGCKGAKKRESLIDYFLRVHKGKVLRL